MLLTDVQPYDSDVLHLSISTKTYWSLQLLSNSGNLFVHLIIFVTNILLRKQVNFSNYNFSKKANSFPGINLVTEILSIKSSIDFPAWISEISKIIWIVNIPWTE